MQVGLLSPVRGLESFFLKVAIASGSCHQVATDEGARHDFREALLRELEGGDRDQGVGDATLVPLVT